MTEIVTEDSPGLASLASPGSIVVGVPDHSGSSERAMWEAALWGARRKRDVTLLTAVGHRRPNRPEGSASPRRRLAIHVVHSAAHRLSRSVDPSQSIRTAVVDLSASEALIISSATAALIVVQQRPRRAGIRCRVEGTVAEVASQASCPVLVVHADDQIVTRRGVLAVLDGRSADVAGLRAAFEEAGVRGVPLTVAECQAGPRGLVPLSTGGRLVRERADAAIETAIADCRRRNPGVAVKTPVESVDSFAVLMSMARDCELLVVSRSARQGECLGPLVRHLVAEAACPVLVLPPGEPCYEGTTPGLHPLMIPDSVLGAKRSLVRSGTLSEPLWRDDPR